VNIKWWWLCNKPRQPRNTSIVIGINSHHPSSKQCESTTGDNYSTGYAQGLNAGKIDGGAGITNVDHCPKYAMWQQYCADGCWIYTGIRGGGEVNNEKTILQWPE
jgi:hypothetical protein